MANINFFYTHCSNSIYYHHYAWIVSLDSFCNFLYIVAQPSCRFTHLNTKAVYILFIFKYLKHTLYTRRSIPFIYDFFIGNLVCFSNFAKSLTKFTTIDTEHFVLSEGAYTRLHSTATTTCKHKHLRHFQHF